MTKDFKSGNVKHLPVKNIDLPNFVNNFSGDNSSISSIEGTNVIRVPSVSYTHLRAHET